MPETTVQTELKVAKSYLVEAEGKLHAEADVIFELGRRVYHEPVPFAKTFAYGDFFGAPPVGERKKPPLDIGTKAEYRTWLEAAAQPIWRDLNAAVERLRRVADQYPGAALIEDGAPKYAATALLSYGWLLLGDYYFYRCQWRDAAKMYRNAFKLSPLSQVLVYRLGLASVNDGDMTRAHNFLERAVEMRPDADVAVEAIKQLDRLATLAGGKKVFHGSPGALKVMVAVTIGGLLVCLSCICCGLLGGWSELASEAGNTQFAIVWTVVAIVLGGLAFLVPAAVTAVYYFAKKR